MTLMARYLYWRGRSLWCTYPLPDKPEKYSLGIKRTSDAKSEVLRCVKLGEDKLVALRAQAALAGTVMDQQIREATRTGEYRPKYWRLVGRYWYYHLRFQKSGKNERFHLAHSLRHFGLRDAKSITREDVELWRQSMVTRGDSVNVVNNRYAYLQAVYSWSNQESQPARRVNYDPTIGMKKLPGARVRTFVLTREKFERNYALLRDGKRWPGEKPSKHCGEWWIQPDPRFALFYLALWETGRRPEEVSQYTWESITEMDGIRLFFVSPELAKTDEPDAVVISDRLWGEMQQLGYRHGLVFRNSTGERWANYDRHGAKLKRVFGADAGWIRDCRRGFVTHKTEVEGHDPRHVRQQSGHRTESVFNRYRIGQLRNQAALFQSSTNQVHSPHKSSGNAANS